LNVLGEDKVYNLLSKCDFTIFEEDEENEGSESNEEGSSLESLDPTQPEEDDSSLEYVKTP
jgi:hypothetical protein